MSGNKKKKANRKGLDQEWDGWGDSVPKGVSTSDGSAMQDAFLSKNRGIFDTESKTVRVASVSLAMTDADCRQLVEPIWRERLHNCLEKIDKLRNDDGGWFKLEGGSWYFSEINSVIPDPQQVEKGNHYSSWPSFNVAETFSFCDERFQGVLPTEEEFRRIVLSEHTPFASWLGEKCFTLVQKSTSTPSAPCRKHNEVMNVSQRLLRSIFPNTNNDLVDRLGLGCRYKRDSNGLGSDSPNFFVRRLPIFRLSDGYVSPSELKLTASDLIALWSVFEILPNELAEEPDFLVFYGLIRKHLDCFSFGGGKFEFTEEFWKNATRFEGDDEFRLQDSNDFGERKCRFIQGRLLSCDVDRADVRPAYEEKRLTSPDPNCGHWDLWAENVDCCDANKLLSTPCAYYARNPRHDVRTEGVIGIDFGTKSTTVVRFVDKETLKPMRVGHANFEELPTEASDYENPTVMQFIDFNTFLEAYRARGGRPRTKWRDLTISHTAADMLHDAVAGASDLYVSFLSELKQWAGGSDTLRIKDKRGEEFILPPYGKLTETDRPDPIEIYAYYLGLNINHMRNGIFLRYELSYPVTYDKDILVRLRESFERGIRKSLPESVLNDKELMKNFYVRFGASEPAAYSLCALSEYGFRPEGKQQKCFYGVFDFGGGTTDFDYGTYRDVTDDEADQGYDYVLEHFRPSGDKFLGGENILQLLAFDVFKRNREMLLREGITFSRPFERENTSFEGEEGLVASSPEAKINMSQVMEALRPLWEGDEKSKEKEALQAGKLRLTLFDRSGEQKSGIELEFDADELEKRIRARIDRGVKNFFIRLKEVFREPEVPKDLEKISIFLAGNSSKSPIVRELFKECIGAFEKDKQDAYKDKFELFPPLGTAEADAKMKERSIEPKEGIEQPTGKTGVAFGLVMGREGGNIKVVDKNQDDTGHIAFRFYVGKQRKGVFVPVLTMASKQGKWHKLMAVGSRKTVEINYSDLPEASTGELPASKTFTKVCTIDSDDNADGNLFIRVKSANEFDWVVAESEKQVDNEKVRTFRLD